ncbi:ShlB/FhaC/HecB family hemolysin secretion/activation protein [Polynucleobacter sp. AP-Nino-20-G2]|uniref:ShlB/FhaC/HecB family hemolysin secretion/activation protein n=1 Tax=Polynucleobacter sp. AP-Nino-20-G2 TaxID=2576917 RepID=UPI001BFDB559|nr:ShlB/FhaC/HecB family hemolysin secretion/activation protein [Polynucleobacter sp. AP-Nino-20-G2]QWE17164.1 ShlB/FhaC/HecB family hemolysin secretion/activation protein [Polynucleobacter sp. AP-Nino-20-G2]
MKKSTATFKFAIASQLLFLSLAVQNAQAQVDAGALQQNLEKQLPLPSPLALPEPGKEKAPQLSTPKEGEATFVLAAFALEGVNILPDAQVQEVLKPYVGISITFADLEKACDAITALYRQHGYSVQAVVLPQSIAKTGGTVKLRITEAKLSSVVVKTPNGPSRFGAERVEKYVTNANPIGENLNLNSIERVLIILNETPGVMVSSQLEAGKNPGETDLNVNLQDAPLFQGRVGLNNYGSRTTGANQATAALGLNNLTGIGDQAALNGISSEGSQYVQGAYSFPGSTDGLRLGVSGTFLQYKNVSSYASPNGNNGDAWTTGFSAAYPLVRTQGSNLNATLGYDIKSYTNRFMATNTTNSAYNIRNVVAGLSGNIYDGFGGGAINDGSVSMTFGSLDILSTSIGGYGTYTPSAFTKFNFSGSRNQSLDAEGLTSLYMAVSGQFASVELNSAEQFYLGGPYGVRAYPVAQGGGAQGGLGTVELRHKLPENLTISGFFDAGIVQQYKNNMIAYNTFKGQSNANNTYSLMGAGLGLKWSYDHWDINGSIAWMVGKNPLYTYAGNPVNNDGLATQPRGWINASYSF